MKKILIIALLILGFSTFALAKTNGTPFEAIWSVITQLQEQVSSIQLTPGPQGPKGDTGEQGPVGPQGESGFSATHGAGNIAFCSETYTCSTVLKTDGTVWSLTGQNVWAQVPLPEVPNYLPVDIEDVVDWDMTRFLDKNGDTWWWNNGSWRNMGHP